MTQLEQAKKGKLTREIRYVSKQEGIDIGILRELVAGGSVVIPASKNHKNLKPVGIGSGMKIKVKVVRFRTAFFFDDCLTSGVKHHYLTILKELLRYRINQLFEN